MDEVFWLREGQVAGRSGPDKHPWCIEDLTRSGFRSVLSVNDGEAVHVTRLQASGMVYGHIPLSCDAPPRAGDLAFNLQQLPKIIQFIDQNLHQGPVLIHCRSGKDRTGLAMAAWLVVREKLSAEEAIKEVIKVRPIALTAPGWLEFAKTTLDAL